MSGTGGFDIAAFRRCRALVVGDLMLDEYVWGSVERISPEAPVQIVNVTREEYTLGGAGNVVNNLRTLGAQVAVAGVIGTLSDGDRMMALFGKIGADTAGVLRDPARPTTRKTRVVAAGQHVVRIDRETRREIAPDTVARLSAFVAERAARVDVVILSDYGKGVVSRAIIQTAVAAARGAGVPVIADPKGLDFTKYAGVTLLTPNQKEAGLAAAVEIADTASLHQAAGRILSAAGIRSLLITRGGEGMALYEEAAPPVLIPAEARQVYDVSGAGDTVISVLGLGLAAGLDAQQAAALANTAAGIVVGKVGTATVAPDELAAALNHPPSAAASKSLPLNVLASRIADLKARGRRVVLTNGCFDLLHVGHIQLLSAAKALGDILIVALDDDASVRRLKGQGRPVIRAAERVRILSALDSVDYVVIFDSNELEQLIRTLRPDLLAKGSNYAPDQVRGQEVVAACGGRIVLVPVSETITSTRIIDAIRRNGTAEP